MTCYPEFAAGLTFGCIGCGVIGLVVGAVAAFVVLLWRKAPPPADGGPR